MITCTSIYTGTPKDKANIKKGTINQSLFKLNEIIYSNYNSSGCFGLFRSSQY